MVDLLNELYIRVHRLVQQGSGSLRHATRLALRAFARRVI
jgi:uncharacterized membrane protein (DUF373 family)